jgi:hypothetical protein
MLHTATVSLALRLGHRISVDLVYFTESDFDPLTLAHNLSVGPECITGQAKGTLQHQRCATYQPRVTPWELAFHESRAL